MGEMVRMLLSVSVVALLVVACGGPAFEEAAGRPAAERGPDLLALVEHDAGGADATPGASQDAPPAPQAEAGAPAPPEASNAQGTDQDAALPPPEAAPVNDQEAFPGEPDGAESPDCRIDAYPDVVAMCGARGLGHHGYASGCQLTREQLASGCTLEAWGSGPYVQVHGTCCE
jgi:hypothetical protein